MLLIGGTHHGRRVPIPKELPYFVMPEPIEDANDYVGWRCALSVLPPMHNSIYTRRVIGVEDKKYVYYAIRYLTDAAALDLLANYSIESTLEGQQ